MAVLTGGNGGAGRRTAAGPAGRRGGTASPAPSAPRSLRRRQSLIAWAFSLPFVLLFAAFTLIPLVSSFVMSFTDFTSTDVQTPFDVNFVGFDQYRTLLENAQFLKSLRNTVYFVVVGIPLTMGIALILAVALNSGISRFRVAFRVGFYTPVVTSIVAVAVVWRFILQQDGPLNAILGWFGIHGPDWLNSTAWAMPSLIGLGVWRNMGTLMVIFLAGLQTIPAEVTEAALIDGAGPVKRFTRITIPLMRPTLLFGAVLLSVWYLQFFEEPFVMTQGGPLNATLSVSYFAFKQFGFGNYAYASAASYVLFVAIALLSMVMFRALRTKED
ncbi:carbohydrate ABC transporter permease [Actinacidiphila oryziradicis]|uniref:Sugar ABC transporter permease n=1 Tax=Actinacidiphila oryziradicis TaxID=2571141 RepID=A0A4U0RNR5_9ACTN|nr:sugar ABC transporter permease [Actinacidiphila oryziradicis]TJZ97513.1 sugar ABC transporter permease [Actinacidiphila oryziradicis]